MQYPLNQPTNSKEESRPHTWCCPIGTEACGISWQGNISPALAEAPLGSIPAHDKWGKCIDDSMYVCCTHVGKLYGADMSFVQAFNADGSAANPQMAQNMMQQGKATLSPRSILRCSQLSLPMQVFKAMLPRCRIPSRESPNPG